ncbi:TonB system biopolymer transport component [Luminiphilus syltensis NOR5-1B]|uniref:TonB system biopolymer transport component n=2 Tax=Luminiphilus TaxID=1341118 RepID=B8KU38_9GAMM|nr:TonB system biopolymer transport component [Luminiphilus syltensis NOR5-1B]
MGAFASAGAFAQEEGQPEVPAGPTPQEVAAENMDQLLDLVKQGRARAAQDNSAREQRFAQDKANQAAELRRAEKERADEEARSARLEKQFEENELLIARKQEQLKERLGTLSELFGHLTAASGDLASNIDVSLVSAQYPGRQQFLKDLIAKMSGTDQLPSVQELEKVWYEMLREISESGNIAKFTAEVATPAGELSNREVVRVGAFNVIDTDGNYLAYENEKLSELPRQPGGAFTAQAAELANATSGLHQFGVDPTGPTGGSFLAAIIDSPTLEERWHQGGYVGYAITAVGAFAFLLAIYRLIVLTVVGGKVSAQLKADKANENNPLGRVLKLHEDNPSMDPETLELKMAEGVLKETPKLESGLTLLKIIAAVAPLMGLLGTVTGMIITFQAITIFGAGDPKAMAGGISGALVTTVLGLLVAIPTVLLHTVVNGRAQRVIHVLNEQATGIVAEHAEAEHSK